MARKPLDQLSPAYRRRIERAEARGLSRQSARGHKAKEHIERKERERAKQQSAVKRGEKAGLTSAQRQIIKRFVERQARLQPKTTKEQIRTARSRMEKLGYARFQEIRAIVAENTRMYKQNDEEPLYEDYDDIMDQFEEDTDLPEWMIYYHGK